MVVFKVHFGHYFQISQDFRRETTITTMIVFRRNIVQVAMAIIGRWTPYYQNCYYVRFLNTQKVKGLLQKDEIQS